VFSIALGGGELHQGRFRNTEGKALEGGSLGAGAENKKGTTGERSQGENKAELKTECRYTNQCKRGGFSLERESRGRAKRQVKEDNRRGEKKRVMPS